MFRRLLTYLGLRAAPSPIRQYAGPVGLFGVLPVAAFVAYKNRDKIASLYREVTHGDVTVGEAVKEVAREAAPKRAQPQMTSLS